MSDRTASEIIADATGYLDDMTFAEFVRNVGFGGILMAIFYNIIEGIDAIGGLFLRPIIAFVDGLVSILSGLFGGWVEMIDESTNVAVQAQVEGTWALLGPLQPIAILLIIMGAIWILLWGLDRMNIGPGAVPLLARIRRN